MFACCNVLHYFHQKSHIHLKVFGYTALYFRILILPKLIAARTTLGTLVDLIEMNKITMIIIFISQLFFVQQWWGEFNAVQICQAGNAVHVGMDG